jgi:hypothetical protein
MNDQVFANSSHPSSSPATGTSRQLQPSPFSIAAALLLASVCIATTAPAQDTPIPELHRRSADATTDSTPASPSTLPNAPAPVAPPRPIQASGIVLGAFCGAGASNSSIATKPTLGCGFGGDLLMIPVFFEFGVMGPQANRSYLTGYMSIDAKVPLRSVNSKYLPVLIGGYSRLFETGHALDYGVALSLPRRSPANDPEPRSLQVELRDYWTFAGPSQHNVMLRVGWLIGASD